MKRNTLFIVLTVLTLAFTGCTENPLDADVNENAETQLETEVEISEELTPELMAALEQIEEKLGAELNRDAIDLIEEEPTFGKNNGAVSINSAKKRYYVYLVDIEGSSPGYGRRFTRQALLLKTRGIRAVGSRTRNGLNKDDFLLFTGEPIANPSAGAIWFATNTEMQTLIPDVIVGDEATDMVTMEYNSRRKRYDMTVDTFNARMTVMNMFNVTSGLFAQVYQISRGSAMFDFTSSLRSVRGEINLRGSGYVHAANAPYIADLEGKYIGSIRK